MSPRNRTRKVGVHPANPSLFVLRRKGFLEEALEPLSATVEWHDLENGLDTGELLRSGEIDVGGTGATPPITLQADGLEIFYVAASDPRPAHGKLVVRSDSEISSVEGLRGGKVALAQGSYQTTLLAVALDQVGLVFDDIEIVDVSGTDDGNRVGRSLLEEGEVDAWVAGDPDLFAAEQAGTVRELVPTETVMSNRSVWFGNRELAERDSELVDAFVTGLQRVDVWIEGNLADAARIFADEGPGELSAEDWEQALSRRPWGPRHIGEDFIAEQQHAADLLARQGIIAREIDIRDAVIEPSPALAGAK
jgi:sulfonate transport system substrate-binding protein